MRAGHNIDLRLLGLWTLVVCVFVVAPLFAVLAVSLTPLDYISLPRGTFSLRWYEQLLHQTIFFDAGINSVVLAIEAAMTALVLGTLAALAIVRYRFPIRGFVQLAVTSPLFIPMVMGGLSILMFFSMLGWESQPVRLYVGHCALTVPYVVRTLSASLTGYDLNQELAARNLGASPIKAFFLVTLPQLTPGLVAGAIFAFIVSFDNVGLSIFLSGAQYRTLPVELLAHVEADNDPMSAALSVVMIVLSMAVVLVAERLVGLQRLMRA
jgi:putative spermidine/putrescine transport system permease protein